MKELLLFYACFVLSITTFGQDLPNPAPNLQLMPEGSFIIAMDNTLQTNTDPNPSKQVFNLKAYGLVVYLLNNNIKVKRIIASGKAKDADDFSVSARMVKPTMDAAAPLRNFRAGPFVVFAGDVLHSNIERLIDNYNNNAGGVSGITNPNYRVKVYQTTADVTVDVRFDYNGFRPRASILNDGGNAPIHNTFMNLAGIPSVNYSVDLNTDLNQGCYTFASEPHNRSPVPAVVTNITSFVMQGGNFLAQCDAIPNYEAIGHFHATNGLTVTNSKPSRVSYPNADLNYAQFEGPFDINQGGSCTNWKLSTGSAFTNFAHFVAGSTDAAGNSIFPAGAAASKVNGLNSLGGMVFYLGNHDFKSITDYDNINGIRMYMNALLTPSSMQSVLKFSYEMSCNTRALTVSAAGGPAVAYPVNFYLYADVGSTPGVVDPGDAFLGAATITTANQSKSILVPPPYDFNTAFVMQITPTSSCAKAETVQPVSCNYLTLPAVLKSFTAEIKNRRVALSWQTTNENSTQGFYVQRYQQHQWKNLAYVMAATPDKGSEELLSYQFTDALEFSGEMQYRLVIAGTGSAAHYSEIRRVIYKEEESPGYSVFPVPSTDGSITIRFGHAAQRRITLMDFSGRVVKLLKEVKEPQVKIQELQPGLYIVRIEEENKPVQLQKIMIR